MVTMGNHYWASSNGQVNAYTKANEILPFFALYNCGVLNGFGFHFNANLTSDRYEHPPASYIDKFFAVDGLPKFVFDLTQSNGLTSMHIFLDRTPLKNFC